MKYSLLITAPPTHEAAHTALAVARAILARGHELYRVFFYRGAVDLARKDGGGAAAAWQDFIRDNRLDAVVCISAALRRDLVCEEESRDVSGTFSRVSAGFQVSGLGQWADALGGSDRILSFG